MRALAAVLALSCTFSAHAQDAVYLRVEGDPSPELRRALEDPRWRPIDEAPAEPAPLGREALLAVARAERLIVSARLAGARLREGEALEALSEARTLLEGNAEVPGVARWLAEVELTTGIIAHQQGRSALAEQSLVRAASLDPARTLGAAEAPPAVVARAEALARTAASRPRTTLALESDAAGARAFVDDRALGLLPRRVELGVGRHVLRVEAPGHHVFARVVDLSAERHAPWRLSLSPTEAEAERRRLAASALSEVSAALREGTVLLWVEAHGDRAIVSRCVREGCSAPARIATGVEMPEGEVVRADRLEERWAGARVWLHETPATRVEPRPWWKRGTTWVAVALGAIVAGVALGFSLRPDRERRVQFVFEPDF